MYRVYKHDYNRISISDVKDVNRMGCASRNTNNEINTYANAFYIYQLLTTYSIDIMPSNC